LKLFPHVGKIYVFKMIHEIFFVFFLNPTRFIDIVSKEVWRRDLEQQTKTWT